MNNIRIKKHPSNDTPDRIYISDIDFYQNLFTLDFTSNQWQLYLWMMALPYIYGYDIDGSHLKIIGVDLFD